MLQLASPPAFAAGTTSRRAPIASVACKEQRTYYLHHLGGAKLPPLLALIAFPTTPSKGGDIPPIHCGLPPAWRQVSRRNSSLTQLHRPAALAPPDPGPPGCFCCRPRRLIARLKSCCLCRQSRAPTSPMQLPQQALERPLALAPTAPHCPATWPRQLQRWWEKKDGGRRRRFV